MKLSPVTYSTGYLLDEIKEIKLLLNANVLCHHFISQHCAVLQERNITLKTQIKKTLQDIVIPTPEFNGLHVVLQ